MSVAAIIYLVVLLLILIGGFLFFIVMDLKNHRVTNGKKTNEPKKAKKHKPNKKL